jgi:NAD(P)-dependent dehydrogenase (short-subunit alcohol dehydrogenase family)
LRYALCALRGRVNMGVIDLFDLTGKVAIVSGGGDGLGRMLALALGEAGSNVVACSRKLHKCEETARAVEKLGVKALPVQCDITKDEDVDRLVGEVISQFKRIDILVNNAGRTWGAAPEDISMADWQKVIDLNLSGTFRITQRVGKEMIKQPASWGPIPTTSMRSPIMLPKAVSMPLQRILPRNGPSTTSM